jgi:hypothetical protein
MNNKRKRENFGNNRKYEKYDEENMENMKKFKTTKNVSESNEKYVPDEEDRQLLNYKKELEEKSKICNIRDLKSKFEMYKKLLLNEHNF